MRADLFIFTLPLEIIDKLSFHFITYCSLTVPFYQQIIDRFPSLLTRIHWIWLSTWDLGLEEIRAISYFAL